MIVDLSAEGGGNCEDTQPGRNAQVGTVTILAPLNVPSLLGENASALYSQNQYHLLELIMKDNIITIDWTDEVLSKTCLTHAGKLTQDAHAPDKHPAGAKASAAPSAGKAAKPAAHMARKAA